MEAKKIAQPIDMCGNEIENCPSLGSQSVEVVSMTDETAVLSPNKLYVWETDVTALSISFASGYSATDEFMLQFPTKEGSTITLPDTVRFVGNSTLSAGYVYQVSVMNDIAVMAGYDNTSSEE